MQTENEKSTTNVAIATVDVAAPAAAPAPTAAASSEVEIEGQPEGAAPAPHHVYIFKRLRREMPPPTKKRIHMVLYGDNLKRSADILQGRHDGLDGADRMDRGLCRPALPGAAKALWDQLPSEYVLNLDSL
jgi:hypothetical protein